MAAIGWYIGSQHDHLLPGVALGVSRHRDPAALTILVQDDVGGLQVRRKKGSGGDEDWVGVPPKKGAFVINVGNIIQVRLWMGWWAAQG